MEITKKDRINAKSASDSLKNLRDDVVVVAVFCMDSTDSETGDPVTTMYLKTEDGRFYGTISETAMRAYDDLTDIIADEGKVKVRVVRRTSSKDREFLSIMVV